MNSLSVGDAALDFTLPDHQGGIIKLSDLSSTSILLLVFNMGLI